MSFSAGEEWTENPETYESSFYKRTLDNEIYIFTAPSFNSKFSDRFQCVCVCVYVCISVGAWRSSVWPGTGPILLSAVGRHPNPTSKDHTLRPLISLSLSFAFFPAAYFSDHPLPPSLPIHFLLSALISLADTRTGKCQCNGAVRAHSYTWLD